MSEQTYIEILIESLEEKSRVLDEVMACDAEQKQIASSENPDLEELDRTIDRIGELAAKVEKLNDGFESVYQKVREELQGNKDAHKAEIRRMQALITEVTEKVVKIEAEESRNKDAIAKLLRGKRKELNDRRRGVQAMNQYSNTMRRIDNINSYFMDKKK